ncbi:SANT/Myb_domain [Hexamita inflata]|uniref:SANT/Myb domain n=1 Tax=Hexamita inflata TaxID=28002 RepID=A0AA86UWC7_9EUKA|nr:SANT/Myb domain [Hexamita inflata]CAI9951208.1 SANT/Myb domain [Hexamita inflata]CAI9951210.1 SANT/Myb domain [Hexamita inflata]
MVRTITRWTEEETALLLKLVDQYRNNFKLVASIFPSRSYNQVKGHYFNIQNRLQSLEEDNKQFASPQRQITTAAPSIYSEDSIEKSKGHQSLDEDTSFYGFYDLFE